MGIEEIRTRIDEAIAQGRLGSQFTVSRVAKFLDITPAEVAGAMITWGDYGPASVPDGEPVWVRGGAENYVEPAAEPEPEETDPEKEDEDDPEDDPQDPKTEGEGAPDSPGQTPTDLSEGGAALGDPDPAGEGTPEAPGDSPVQSGPAPVLDRGPRVRSPRPKP